MARREIRATPSRVVLVLSMAVCLLGLIAIAMAHPGLLSAQEVAEAAHEASPGLFDVNFGLTIWTVVIFLLLLGVLGKFAWGPILASAKTREDHIQNALDEAAARQAEAVKLLEQHKSQMADARRQVQELIAEGKTAGERVKREIEEKARTEAQRVLDQARTEIGREKDAAIDQLRKESVDIALAAAGRLMQQKLDGDADRKLVASFVDDLVRKEGTGARA
jgi:F-type H+-transporting ATPase subunit b